MIDDMHGIYTHASEAYKAGERAGRWDYWRSLRGVLGWISVKYEKDQSELGTRGFHVAEECMAAARELREKIDAERQTV